MKIKVLGSGCKKCKILMQNVEKTIKENDIDAVIEKVEDIQKIIAFGVMSTPALVVDEVVKSTGKVLKPKDILKLIS